MSIELYTTYRSHNGRTAIQPSARGQSRLEKPLNMSLHSCFFAYESMDFLTTGAALPETPITRQKTRRYCWHGQLNAVQDAGDDRLNAVTASNDRCLPLVCIIGTTGASMKTVAISQHQTENKNGADRYIRPRYSAYNERPTLALKPSVRARSSTAHALVPECQTHGAAVQSAIAHPPPAAARCHGQCGGSRNCRC